MRKLLTLTGLAAAVVGLLAATTSAAPLVTVASGSVTLVGQQLGVPGDNRTFAFTVNETSDGTVGGQLQVRSFSGSLFHGNVNCITIEGNQAIVGGVITKDSTVPQFVGLGFAFAIQDNPDAVTFVNFPFGSTPCEEFLPELGYANIDAALADQGIPISTGNIIIKQIG